MKQWTTHLGLALVCVLSAACGNLSKGGKPKIEVFIGSTGDSGLVDYEFAAIIPGSNQRDTVNVSIRNVGDEPLELTNVRLMDKNADGSDLNPWVRIEWGGFDPQIGFPRTIGPNDFLTALELKLVYEPGVCNDDNCRFSNAATVEVTSNSPDEETIILRFAPPQCTSQPNVQPPQDTFFNATPTAPETKIFQIHNNGNCDDQVMDLRFKTPTNVFTLERDWTNGTTLPPKTEPGYKPLVFKVKYQPSLTSKNDAVTVQIVVGSLSAPIEVPLATIQEEGKFTVSHSCGADQGKLDFTDVDSGCETCVVNLFNDGPASMQITGATFPEDPDATHYSCEFKLPESGQTVPCSSTVGRGAGSSLDIEVSYCGSLNGLNATLKVSYNNPNHGELSIPAFGGKPKPCFDFAPGDSTSPLVMLWVAEKDVAKERPFYIYNCGNADLTIDAIRFEDAFQGSSDYFSLVSEAPPVTIPAAGLYAGQVQLLITDNEIGPEGVMYIDYTDGTGAQVTDYGVTLKGYVGPPGTPPTAVASASADATVGQQATLIGTGSQPGSEGIADKGYVWFLMDKPAGSQVVVNGGAGNPNRLWVPDVAGTYLFGLMVHGNSGNFLFSDVATVEVNVVAAE